MHWPRSPANRVAGGSWALSMAPLSAVLLPDGRILCSAGTTIQNRAYIMPIRPVQIQKNGMWVELPEATAVKVSSDTYEVTISGVFKTAANQFDKDSLRVHGHPATRAWCSNHADGIVVLEVQVERERDTVPGGPGQTSRGG